MPRIDLYNVDVSDIDIDVEDFLYECSERDIQQIINYLKEENYLKQDDIIQTGSLGDEKFIESLDKLKNKRLNLTLEEEQMIIDLANKF